MFKEIIDISLPLNQGTISFPGDQPYKARRSKMLKRGDPYNLGDFRLSMHSGTHIDAPLHFFNDGLSVTDIEPTAFAGEAKVFLIDTERQITRQDLQDKEIAEGDRILLKVPRNEKLLRSGVFSPEYIAFDSSAAAYLIEKQVSLVGTEYLSVDRFTAADYPVHRKLLKQKVIILEGIDLSLTEPGKYFLVCFPLKLTGANGSPVRAILMR